LFTAGVPTIWFGILQQLEKNPGGWKLTPLELARTIHTFFTTERTGTGLGLYITREMCEANQARVTYSRDQRGGSCFRITFAHPDRITA